MTSPFPGMDPYLETPAFWSDFHARFITHWCDAIGDALPGSYDARIDERVIIEMGGPERQLLKPDVAVMRAGPAQRRSSAPTGATTLEPVTLRLMAVEERTERHIEILRKPDRTLVAVLELLSPSNKEEPGRSEYRAKRGALVEQPVHWFELDLLLKGQRYLSQEKLPAGDYYAFVSRWDHYPECDVYHWTMQQPLPTLPIPLLPADGDVWVDIGAVFRTTYDRGKYERAIDYASQPPVAVDADRLAWIAERTRGRASA